MQSEETLKVGDKVRVIGRDEDLRAWRSKVGVVEKIKPQLAMPVLVRFRDGNSIYLEAREIAPTARFSRRRDADLRPPDARKGPK